MQRFLLVVYFLEKLILSENLIFQPKFAAPIVNLSVAVGRDATFKCLVHHLENYKVGWVKADTKAIQAIDRTVITHNSRISVSHESHGVWNLHIKDITEEDRGLYMCQINTDPMKSQVGFLEVLIPPDFIQNLTSSDILTPEGNTIRLRCSARGHPPPHVIWRREDGRDIIIRRETIGYESNSRSGDLWSGGNVERINDDVAWHSGGNTLANIKVSSYQGEILKLSKISRHEMGVYLCIASNGVPPSISKRIMVHVHFAPLIHVPNQLVGAPLNTQVTIDCYIQAYPSPISYWLHDSGEIITNNEKYDILIKIKSLYETHLVLKIKNIIPQDLGTYQCIAKNSLGESDNNIRLYEIPGPTKHYSIIQIENNFENSEINNKYKIISKIKPSKYNFENFISNLSKDETALTQPEKNSQNSTNRFKNISNRIKYNFMYNLLIILILINM